MSISRELKKKLWLKVAAIMIATSIFYGVTYYLFNRIAGITVINPFFPVLGAIIIAILLPFLIKIYAPRKIFINDDYNAKEKEFEEKAENTIATNVDEKTYEKLFMDDLNLIPIDGIQICTSLLSQSHIQENPELKFYILVKLANYYFNNGDYKESITTLNKALSIKPNDIVANMRIAELYERIDLAEEAISHYNAALTSTEALTGNLREFIGSQIHRVKTEGPRVKQPPDNFKWFTG